MPYMNYYIARLESLKLSLERSVEIISEGRGSAKTIIGCDILLLQSIIDAMRIGAETKVTNEKDH